MANWASSAKRGWTRLTTRAVTDISDSASLPAKWTASSTESGRGEATRMKAVSSWTSSSRTRAARVRKPSSIPSKAWKKATASWTMSAPATLEMVRRRAWAATPMNLSPARVGFISAWKTRFPRKWVSRLGASRKSRALRVGGVSTTTRSNPPSSTSS